MNMLKKYLLSNVYRDGDTDAGSDKTPAKTPAEIEREKIKVENNDGDLARSTQEAKDAEGKETGEEGEAGKDEGEGTEEVEGEIDDAEATAKAAADKEAELKAAKEAETDPEEKKKIQRRIDREVGKRKAAETRAEQAEAKLAQLQKEGGEKLTEADVEERSEKKAAVKQAEREFDAACERLAKAGNKANKENFDKNVKQMAAEIGPIPTAMIGILDELDNGGEVLNYLADPKNIDEMEDIYKLPPTRMAIKLAKVAEKVEAAKKPAPRQMSRVPAQGGTPSTANKGSTQQLRDDMPMSDWVATRERDLAEKRKLGLTKL